MMYDVPQTDSLGEPAMLAMVARVRGTAPKPEIFAHGQLTTGEVDARLALLAAQWVARISSALGNRATLPLLRWDAGLDGVLVALVTHAWLNHRGRERSGADKMIDAAAQEAQGYLARLRRGGDDSHTEHPVYEDSGGNFPVDAPLIRSCPTSDYYVRRRR